MWGLPSKITSWPLLVANLIYILRLYFTTLATTQFIRTIGHVYFLFKKNWPTPASFIIYLLYFQTSIIPIFTTNTWEKCPSSIQCRDLNPRPSEHDTPPITTRPGLPPLRFLSSIPFDVESKMKVYNR